MKYRAKKEGEREVRLENLDDGVSVVVDGFTIIAIKDDGTIERVKYVDPDDTGLAVDGEGRVVIK